MRQIKFRGKRIDYGESVYGDLIENQGENYIYPWEQKSAYTESKQYEPYPRLRIKAIGIDPATIGQYTGLNDKSGKEIYEGDILKVKTGWYKSQKENEEAKFDRSEKGDTYWSVEHKTYHTEMGYFTFGIDRRFHKPLTKSRLYNAEATVAGNIHDNPELLEVAK